jgi:drug/metabolite transporter (DMT)-like permease
VSIALLFLLPVGYRQVIDFRHVWVREWKPLVGLAITGIVGFNVLMYVSLNYTTSIHAAIVDASTPVVAAILGFFLLKERLTGRQTMGIVLSISGVLWIITGGSWEIVRSLSFNIGDLIMFTAVVFWAIYSIIIKLHGQITQAGE